ncbi:calpain-A-like isoform X2 [Rhodnius prolixus]|uniref:calpain-A-like isoform X2 n=1 Tax=Rhodnius prolixus TaxID=13249 RepID=UPI003D18BBBA
MPYKKRKLLIYNFGEKGSGVKPRPSIVQDYIGLKAQCLSRGSLFEDPLFPADNSTLFYSKPNQPTYKWKRPGEICNNPKFFVSGASRLDVQQGFLGDCWLSVTIANLSLNQHIFELIVPNGQSFEENYAGIFHFRFWRFGRWVDVVIDDRLPTDQDELAYLHSSDKNEFWSALLHKAYAKIHGSYEALNHGNEVEAMEDFTGGICEMFSLRLEVPDNLFTIMLKAFERSSLMTCATPAGGTLQKRTPQGLITDHSYSVTKVQYVEVDTPTLSGRFPLIRLRNPWGQVEWNGAWSDNWPEWKHISEKTKEELKMQQKIDGEFWISYTDFLQCFNDLSICNLHPDSLIPYIYKDDDSKLWKLYCFEGEWVRGSTAGGCTKYKDTYWRNPQYRIKLAANFKNDSEKECTVIIALMQKHTRSQKNIGAVKLEIGFHVHYLQDPDNLPKPLDRNFFLENIAVVVPSNFINSREVSYRYQLSPGEYCIVPTTYNPNEEGEFLLRVFTKKVVNMEEYGEELEISKPAQSKVQEPRNSEKIKLTTNSYAKFAGGKEIDWVELKEILDEEIGRNLDQGGTGIISKALSLFSTKYDSEATGGFSKEICRSFIAMMDTDRSCKLGLEEFTRLFIIIQDWKAVFESYDKAKTGYLEPFSLNEALKSAGFKLNNRVRNALCHIYASSDGRIRFDDFFMCAVRLDTVMNNFRNIDPNNTNEAKFTLEEWVAYFVYF